MVEIKSLMKLISISVKCKTTNMVESEEQIKWYPVLKVANTGFSVGLCWCGVWVLEAKYGLYILNDPSEFWRLVSLLEESSINVREKIAEFLDTLGITMSIYDCFPFVEIVQAGFRFGTNYWAELAFKWFDEMPFEKKIYLNESLILVKNAKWASQKLRHKAMKELKYLHNLMGSNEFI